MDCPCRSGLSDGFDLRSGMGQGGTGGSPPTSNPLSATAGPQHFSGLQCTAVPCICQAIYRTCTCSELACTTTAPQRKRGTATVLSLARASTRPAHVGPLPLQSQRISISLLPSSPRIASHRITPRSTHPSSISDLLCCQCSTRPDRMQSSSGVGAAITWPAPHSAFSSLPTACFLASRISHHTPADSTVYVAGEFLTGISPRLG